MHDRVSSSRGRAIYAKRKVLVEPVFGQIKSAMGFRRLSLRGLQKAAGEWGIVCACHHTLLKLLSRAVRSGAGPDPAGIHGRETPSPADGARSRGPAPPAASFRATSARPPAPAPHPRPPPPPRPTHSRSPTAPPSCAAPLPATRSLARRCSNESRSGSSGSPPHVRRSLGGNARAPSSSSRPSVRCRAACPFR